MPTRPSFDAHERAFYLAYGEAMGHWAELESYLGNLFVILTGLDLDKGRAIFYSARSLQGRIDMVSACLPFAKVLPGGRAFLVQFINKVRSYSSARNNLAHDRHAIFSDWGSGGDDVHRYIESQDGAEIGIDQLAYVAFNFEFLSEILKVSIGHTKLVPEPELSQALLDLMPVDPLASVEYRTKAVPLLAELELLQQSER